MATALCLTSVATLEAQTLDLPVTFDVATVTYTTVDFGGVTTTLTTDPTNAANHVAMTVKNSGSQTWGGTTMGAADFTTNFPFHVGQTKVSMRVYSPAVGLTVKLKIEDPTDGTKNVEADMTTTVANTWETLVFDFATQATGTQPINFTYNYRRMSVFFHFGVVPAAAETFYWDDVMLVTAAGPLQLDLPVTFDVANTAYNFVDFGGVTSTVGTDPANVTNHVGVTIKNNAAQTWGGTTVGMSDLASNIPFSATKNKISMKVYAPAAGITVRMKVEDPTNATKTIESDATTSVANAWETLVFDFANQAAGTQPINYTYTYRRLSVFFHFNTVPAVAETYYWDDIMMVLPPPPSVMTLPVTFDSTGIIYSFTDFGGVSTTRIVDPANASNHIAATVKDGTAQTWGGVTVGAADFATNFPLHAGQTKMSMKVKSPAAGIVVKLKIEDPTDATKSVETDVTTTVANAWETLVFDFTNQATGTAGINYTYNYRRASAFFHFGVVPSAAETFYWDDLKLVSGIVLAPLNLPVTFEIPNTDYSFVDFGGNASVLSPDPVVATNMVAKTTKTAAAQTWAGTTMGGSGFGNAIPFAAGHTIISMRVYSPDAGIVVRLKAEDKTDATKSVETNATTTVANGWQTLAFDFANQAAGTAAINYTYTFNKLSAFFNFGVDGATAGDKTYYWDDVQFGVVGTTNVAVPAFTFAPNPVRDALRINSEATVTEVRVFNLLGQEVLRQSMNTNSPVIDVHSLEAGAYSVRIAFGDASQTVKMIKE